MKCNACGQDMRIHGANSKKTNKVWVHKLCPRPKLTYAELLLRIKKAAQKKQRQLRKKKKGAKIA